MRPLLALRLIHNLAREAGIATMGTPGQVTYVGCGVAVAHRIQPGELTVTFGAPVDLIDPVTEQVTAAGVRDWSPEVKLLETGLVYYRLAK